MTTLETLSATEPGAVEVDWPRLRKAAISAMKRAYAPYSDFPVGAAGLVDDGRTVAGCNVESASYGLTLCAECGMVSALHASGGGRLVAVVCVDADGSPLTPCGRCRQLLWEHGGPECLVDSPGGVTTLAELLPNAFGSHDLTRVNRSPDTASAVPARLAAFTGQGTVFVHPDSLNGNQVWTAYWDRSCGADADGAGILEEAPTWVDISTAVRWGRARTPRVIVVDASGRLSWAGSGTRPGDIDQDWSR